MPGRDNSSESRKQLDLIYSKLQEEDPIHFGDLVMRLLGVIDQLSQEVEQLKEDLRRV